MARRLVDAQFPKWADLPIKPLSISGSDNSIFRLGDELTLRFPRVEWAAQTAPREVAILGALGKLPLDVPRPRALGEPDANYPWQWSVFDWIEGEAASAADLSAEDAEGLASFILALRQETPDLTFASSSQNHHRGVPLSERDVLTRTAIDTLSDEYGARDLLSIWQAALDARCEHEPVWLHGDLHGGNLLVREGKLVAVIDWGLAGVGDGACDLAAAWTLMDAQVRDRFREVLKPNADEWLRGMGWALSIAVIFLAHYRALGVPVDGSRRTLSRLLASQL
ncbi:MAG: aminoglycoside phosphotransferase family protein [Pseudomonadota bacterium]